MENKIQYIIYSDGACSGNPGPGGWGAVILDPTQTITVGEISGKTAATTNNRMEMQAAIEAIKYLEKLSNDPCGQILSTKSSIPPLTLKIITDSTYLKEGITKWIYNWKKNGWRKGTIKNAELWQELDELNSRHFIEWMWVRGHGDNVHNNRADKLARAAIDAIS